jgi:murein DD-endopeptidase MepM/ murein hydrolase activator NlpD
MSYERFARLRSFIEEALPERHIYVRSEAGMRGVVLTTGKQLIAVGVTAALTLWLGVATTAMMINALSVGSADREAAKVRAYYERLTADRQARLNSAMAQLSDTSGGVQDLAEQVEKRHVALAMLLSSMKGAPGVEQALAPIVPAKDSGASPLGRVRSVLMDQERLIAQASEFADTRAERLRLAFRLAGLNPAAYTGNGSDLGGPLIEAKDPRALAAILDVDERFAARIQRAAGDMKAMHDLSEAADELPFERPTDTAKSSGFGVRFDPFTRRPAYHSGLDFSGGIGVPIHATAPGVVSFVGQRSGYGNCVEIDHGRGFKTRYAHLSAFGVKVGQRVGVGQRIAAMGSTGRSTGPHLHYEVWVDGRATNPDRFVKAGEYVREARS